MSWFSKKAGELKKSMSPRSREASPREMEPKPAVAEPAALRAATSSRSSKPAADLAPGPTPTPTPAAAAAAAPPPAPAPAALVPPTGDGRYQPPREDPSLALEFWGPPSGPEPEFDDRAPIDDGSWPGDRPDPRPPDPGIPFWPDRQPPTEPEDPRNPYKDGRHLKNAYWFPPRNERMGAFSDVPFTIIARGEDVVDRELKDFAFTGFDGTKYLLPWPQDQVVDVEIDVEPGVNGLNDHVGFILPTETTDEPTDEVMVHSLIHGSRPIKWTDLKLCGGFCHYATGEVDIAKQSKRKRDLASRRKMDAGKPRKVLPGDQ
jgi:hypothetical protein